MLSDETDERFDGLRTGNDQLELTVTTSSLNDERTVELHAVHAVLTAASQENHERVA
jgi:hypothetical protein